MKILYLIIAVLKFLGIAILLLLLLLLFLALVIMTVPIKYSIYINKSENIYVITSFKWLYSIVSLDIIYDSNDKLINKFRLFGGRIDPKKIINLIGRFLKKADDAGITKMQQSEEIKEMEQIEDIQKLEKTAKTHKKPKTKKKVKNKKGSFSQIRLFEYKKELIMDSLNLMKSIIRNIRPSSLKAEVEIGRDNPADTGNIMAAVTTLYPFYYSFANIVGNYEKECFYVKLEAEGRITVGKFVYEFIKYIRIKSVREFMKFTRKNKKNRKGQ